jgi:hypothetical protein
MSTIRIIALLFWAATTVLWAGSVWGSWARRLYEQQGPESVAWYWLRVVDIPRTRENCIRFVRIVSLAGMVLVTLMVAAILITQP